VWAITLLAAVLLLGVLLAMTRRPQVAGLAATALVWLMSSADLDRMWLGILMLMALAAVFVMLRRILRRPIPVVEVTRGLNLLAVLLLALAVGRGVVNGAIPASLADLTHAASAISSRPDGGLAPDIYLVMLDGYPRADILEEITGANNSAFIAALEERGFTVAGESRSSYMYSDLTGTALFHGRHLDEIPELAPLFNGSDMPALGRQVLNEAPLVERLRELGYVIIANAQAWDEPALRNVDIYIEGTGLNEFERQRWSNSLPGSLWELQGPVVFQDGLEPWVHDAFAALGQAVSTDLDRPRFAYIHVPSPHFPIIFEADGSRADPVFGREHPALVTAPGTEVRAAYAEQVEYLNRRVIESLDAAALPDDAIVAVISDHGPEFGLDWQDGTKTDRRTRFGAFLAVRNAPEPFPADANVSSTLLSLLRGLGVSDLPPMGDRYFVTDAFDKLATIQEVPDPYQEAAPVEGD
jgi:hypothetical protein